MESPGCIGYMNQSECLDFCDNMFDIEVQKNLDAAMPWIGMYIAAASAVCTLAMAADAVHGFRNKKFWFPCKYFSLSSTSLTLLAVSMKLPMDLTTIPTNSDADRLAKLSSLVFMSTSIGSFITSLGSMNDKEILTNITALGILSATIVVNVWIYLIEMRSYLFRRYMSQMLFPTIYIFLLVVTLISSAISVQTAKRRLELNYQEMHKITSREEQSMAREIFKIDVLRAEIMKYWVMAETGSPQFVIARSVVCTTSTTISLLGVITLAESYIRLFVRLGGIYVFSYTGTAYGSYTKWILTIQSIGVLIGGMKLIIRWFVVVSFDNRSFKKEFKIETHWIQTLVDWRDNLSTSQIQNYKCRKYLHDAKWLALNLCISLQIFIVYVSKLFVFYTTLLGSPFLICCTGIKKFKIQYLSKVLNSDDAIKSVSGDESELNLKHYVLLLEGEIELPNKILKNIKFQVYILKSHPIAGPYLWSH